MFSYSVGDLSKCIVREFLLQNNYIQTYQAFEKEDPQAQDKIPKVAIVKSLCLEHLLFANKKAPQPLKSLLEVLVSYLNHKYITKSNDTSSKTHTLGQVPSVTSQNFYSPISHQDDAPHINSAAQSTKQRPGSARKPLKQEPLPTKNHTPTLLRTFDGDSVDTKPRESKQTQQTEGKKEEVPPFLSRTIPEGIIKPAEEVKKEKLLSMFGKRKQEKKESSVEKPHPIFHHVQENTKSTYSYTYKSMQLGSFNLQQPIKSELTYVKPTLTKNKRKPKSISLDISSSARRLIFQGQSKALSKAWKQGVLLSPFDATFYGLQQLEGGPCGIIAALQCYYLKHLLHLCPLSKSSLETRENCVVAAIADMLYSINPNRVVLALPATINNYARQPISIEDVELLTLTEPKSLSVVYEAVYSCKSEFLGQSNSGYTLLLYSCILTKGVETICQEMDSCESPLIGNHGHCNQELVNLFITGRATTNVFNGVKSLSEGADKVELKGIAQQAQFGFLTVFETLGYVEVRIPPQVPRDSIWIICKEFHYHVVFGQHYMVSCDPRIQKLDLVYFDGLYNCGDKIILTLGQFSKAEQEKDLGKVTDLPLIEQVLLTKWGRRQVNWNGSIKIL